MCVRKVKGQRENQAETNERHEFSQSINISLISFWFSLMKASIQTVLEGSVVSRQGLGQGHKQKDTDGAFQWMLDSPLIAL